MKYPVALAAVLAGSVLLAACTGDASPTTSRCQAHGPAALNGSGGPAGDGVPANVAGSGC